MPAFTYRALAADGAERRGRLDADDVAAAQRAVEALGLLPVAVEGGGAAEGVQVRVPAAQVLAFARSLAGLLGAGVPLSRALAVLEREASHSGARSAWAQIHARVRDGDSLATAMATQGHLFPPVFVAMVRAGETGGFLGVVLEQVADYLERTRELKGKVGAALIYPALLATIATLVVSFLLVWFIPRFATLFASFHRELPFITRCIQAVSDGLVHHGWILVVGIVAAVIAFRMVVADPRGAVAWERVQFALPAVRGLRAALARVRFCRMLGTLLKAGVPLVNALTVARASVGSALLETALAEAGERIRQGTSISAALRRDPGHPLAALLPGTALEVLAVAEDSGRLPDELLRLADRAEKDLDRHLRAVVALAEPLLLLVMAALVGTIVVGMLMPIFDLWSAVG